MLRSISLVILLIVFIVGLIILNPKSESHRIKSKLKPVTQRMIHSDTAFKEGKHSMFDCEVNKIKFFMAKKGWIKSKGIRLYSH